MEAMRTEEARKEKQWRIGATINEMEKFLIIALGGHDDLVSPGPFSLVLGVVY